MQTSFSPEQLKDPAVARSNEVLRTCVHCGFCTATCPTYQVLGDELDSPRGRIYLIKDMLEKGRPADEKTVKHVDRCLSCLACMSTCPSGVHYMHLVDHARAWIEETYKRPWHDRALRWTLARILPYPNRFRWALAGAKLARPVARFMPSRLRAMIELAPRKVPPVSWMDDAQVFEAQGSKVGRVALMTGCAQRALDTDINAATIRVLTRHGIEVVIAKDMGCCGALVHHMGRESESHAAAKRNIKAWTELGELDAIVINTSGCGTTVKDYGHMLRGDDMADAAATVSALAKDVSEVLTELELKQVRSPTLKVAYHAACSLQHGQQVKQDPKTALRTVGYEIVEPADSHLCCGSAGTYNIMQPKIASELKVRKVATLEALSPDVIAAGNIGCMMQIGSGTTTPIVHTIELIDWATGGPKPAKLDP